MLTSGIIICTRNREKDLKRCLDSLFRQTVLPDELIVVDSGSDEAEKHVVQFEERIPSCRVQYVRSEPGLTRQRNLGIRHARADILHFLDDDVDLNPRYIEEIRRTYDEDRDSRVLAVGPVLRLPRPRSRWGSVFRRLFLLCRVDGEGRLAPSGFPALSWYGGFKDVHPITVGCGCCTFRREVFEQIQYDEWFEDYGFMEDVDFTASVARLGVMLENPRAQMLHIESPAARLDWRRLTVMQIVNHHYVFKKHLPRDTFHWCCFWWSELGESLRRLFLAAREVNVGILKGMVTGYATILMRKGQRSSRDCAKDCSSAKH